MSEAALEVFFDGECPLCRREIDLARRLDRRGQVLFTDISAPGFEPPPSRSFADMMARIHGRLPDGALIEGVEVFRRLYAALGFGPLVALSRVPPLSWLAELGYRWFARNRLRLTGRCTDDRCATS